MSNFVVKIVPADASLGNRSAGLLMIKCGFWMCTDVKGFEKTFQRVNLINISIHASSYQSVGMEYKKSLFAM